MKKRKTGIKKLVVGTILIALFTSVTTSFGHTHDDGREKTDCPYDLFLQQYTALESEDIRLTVPEAVFEPRFTAENEYYFCHFSWRNSAYPNAPPR